MENYFVKPNEPTVLAGKSYYKLRGTDLNLPFKVDTAHVVPGPIDLGRFNDALAKALSVYPLFAGRMRRPQQAEDPWQVELTNDGVPVAIVDSDAEQEVPHNCVIQNPWTLTQGVKTVNLWDYNSDEPLLRVTIIRFTRLGSTSIGLSGSHVVGDGTVFRNFARSISQCYQGLPLLDAPPSYADIPEYPFDPAAYPNIPFPEFHDPYPIHSTPPFAQPDRVKAVRVDLRFTSEQVVEIQRGVRRLAGSAHGEDARTVSRQDALWALLVYCMSKVDPDCYAQSLSTIVMHRGVAPRPATAMTNSLIWAVTDPVDDPSAETIYSIARRVRQSIERTRDPGYAAAYDAAHSPIAIDIANKDMAQNFTQPPGHWVINSTWKFDWASADFGYEGRTRFFHTLLDEPRFAKFLKPNPIVNRDGTVSPSTSDVEVTFYLHREAREKFDAVLVEEMRRLGIKSDPEFVSV